MEGEIGFSNKMALIFFPVRYYIFGLFNINVHLKAFCFFSPPCDITNRIHPMPWAPPAPMQCPHEVQMAGAIRTGHYSLVRSSMSISWPFPIGFQSSSMPQVFGPKVLDVKNQNVGCSKTRIP